MNVTYNNDTSDEALSFAIVGIILLVLVIGGIFTGNYLCKKFNRENNFDNTKVDEVMHTNEKISFKYVHPYRSSQILTSNLTE